MSNLGQHGNIGGLPAVRALFSQPSSSSTSAWSDTGVIPHKSGKTVRFLQRNVTRLVLLIVSSLMAAMTAPAFAVGWEQVDPKPPVNVAPALAYDSARG